MSGRERLVMHGIPDWAVLIEKPEEHIGEKVHVQYYTPGCTYILREYDADKKIALLETPSTHKMMKSYQTLYFRRNHEKRI